MKHQHFLFIARTFLFAFSLQASTQESVPVRASISREQTQMLIQETERQVDSILKKEIYLPGLAVALVSRDEVLWAKAFGHRDALR